jgi:hypothetical protein
MNAGDRGTGSVRACTLVALVIALGSSSVVGCGGGAGAHGAPSGGPDAAPNADSASDLASDSSADAGNHGDEASTPTDTGADAGADTASDAGTRADADAAATGLLYGANIHSGGGNAAANQQVADLLHARNLKTVRMDFGSGQNAAPWRDQVQKLNAVGIKAETTLFPTYQYSTSCNLDLTATQNDAYAQTTTMVNAVKDLVTDFELMNEVTLRAELQGEVASNSKAPASAYAGKPCYAVKLAVIQGMYRAIRDVAQQSGTTLRVIAGTVGRDWGYLDFLRQNGVDFDVVGYHIYPSLNQADWNVDTWYGPSGLFSQLAAYGRPVHINEFNCGEIYQGSFENDAGAPLTEECFKSVAKYVLEILGQSRANIESVHYYEMFDEASKAAPENHFGLWYDAATPKVTAYLASAFAGGSLSASEENEITSRGLLTAAQITQFK